MIDEQSAADVMADEPEVAEVADAKPAWSPEDEDEARQLGWKSPEEWTGEFPPGYIDDPKKFRDRAMTFGPVRKLLDELQRQKRDGDVAIQRVRAMADAAVRRTQDEARAEIQRITAEQRRVAEAGDMETYDALERRKIDVARGATEATRAQEPNSEREEIERWAVDKEWFQTDKIKQAAAVAAFNMAESQGYTTPTAKLRYVDRVIAERFPDRVPERAPVRTQPAVEGGMPSTAQARQSAFSKLPRAAQAEFTRQVGLGWWPDDDASRKQYANLYNNPNGGGEE